MVKQNPADCKNGDRITIGGFYKVYRCDESIECLDMKLNDGVHLVWTIISLRKGYNRDYNYTQYFEGCW